MLNPNSPILLKVFSVYRALIKLLNTEINIMGLKVTPQEAAEKWKRRMQGAAQDYRDGVNRVDTAPGQKAAQNKQGYINGVQENADRWATKVAAVSLEDWKSKAIEKGAARLASGADAAMEKVMRTTEANFRNIEDVKNQVDRMPKATLQDRIARMNAFVIGMSEKKLR